MKFGFHYFITPSDSYRAPQTFAHELGHGLLGLGDEYMDSVAEQSDLTSLNVAYTHDPENVKWKQLLGFRKTYTCPSTYTQKAYNSSFECLMRDTNYSFCEVCRLQGYKKLSQLVEGKNLYVADPEVKEYTGQYSSLSDFKDTSYYGYNKFNSYRSGVLLSGSSKNRFGNSMAGKQIELRTIVQNLSDTTERSITMKLWISRADGSVATTTNGSKLEAAETFLVPVWSEKSNFWPKGALDYTGSNFNSGLLSCSMIYQIPSDVTLKDGDYVAFEVTDEKGNVLANDNTENQTYANVTIQYCLEDGSQIPNTNSAEIPAPVGTKFDGSMHPVPLYGYTFVRADGLDQMVTSRGLNVTYYYAKQAEEHIWSEWSVTAKPTASTNGEKKRTCSVCGESETEIIEKFAKNCVADGNLIYGLYSGMNVNDFSNYFSSDYAAITVDAKKNIIGTGTKINALYPDGTSVEYNAVIFGDVDGDGLYDGQDAVIVETIVSGMLSYNNLNSAAYTAADANHDGTINESDAEILRNAGIYSITVSQTKN